MSFQQPVVNCNGEVVIISGEFTSVEINQKDGTQKFRQSFHGTGIGSEGNEYVFNRTFQQDTRPGTGTEFTTRFNLVSKGSEPNFTLIASLKDGQFEFDSDCRG